MSKKKILEAKKSFYKAPSAELLLCNSYSVLEAFSLQAELTDWEDGGDLSTEDGGGYNLGNVALYRRD